MKKFTVILLIAFVAIGLSFSSEASADTTLTLYNTLDEDAISNLIDSFEEEHEDVSVEYVQLSTGEVQSRLEAEADNPQADLWTGGVGLGHIEVAERGLTAQVDSDYRDENIPEQFVDEDGRWSGIYLGALSFTSNEELLELYDLEAPESWEDLIQPEFTDMVQKAYPATSGTAYNMMATIIQIMGEEEGFEYLQQLDDSVVSYTRSGFRPAQNVAMGETPVAIAYAHDVLQQQDEGYPVQITFPEEGTGYEVASVSKVEGAPNPEYARKFYDHMLSTEAMAEYAYFYSIPVHQDVTEDDLREGAITLDELEVIDQDDVWAAEEQERLLDKWEDEVY